MVAKTRYIDRDVLCNYDFKEELIDILGIKVYDIIPLRKVFILFTDKGKKVLKITESTKERIDFIDNALKLIEERYKNVLRYSRNKNGQLITQWNGKQYVLLDMVEGREASFTNPVEVELCTKAMAEIHLASKGISLRMDKGYTRDNYGENMIYRMKNEYSILIELQELVNKFKYKNEFDRLFISSVDNAKDDLINTIKSIEDSEYERIALNKDDMVLCHNDLAHHNFIIDGDDVNIIDFDYCNIDMRIIDIYEYTMKVIKSLAYNEDIINLIIKSYNNVAKLQDYELDILKKLIRYPKDFITISINYYFKQKKWDYDVFLSRLKSKLDIDKFRIDLINNAT